MSKLKLSTLRSQSSQEVPGSLSLQTNGGTTLDESAEIRGIITEKGKSKEIERLWGLENFGNTCYCNSVLQALYACEPFRLFIESYGDAPAPISALAPPPGESQRPTTTPGPTSPLATKSTNPFDNPILNSASIQAATSPTTEKKRGLFSRRPTSSSSAQTPSVTAQLTPAVPTTPVAPPAHMISDYDIDPVTPNPNGVPPSVFETVQTLFYHLNTSLPHQPLPVKKEQKQNAENAQTASLLPAAGAAANGQSPGAGDKPGANTPSSAKEKEPQGPPLLASLPPPSAPRGGGPFQAGTLGRGVVRPEDLLKTVKRENDMFRGMSQQDAHEFLGWVLNKVAEDVELIDRSLKDVGKNGPEPKAPGRTFVQRLFEGVLTNETRCLSCETTSSRDEAFLDLSIDIEQHTSVTACLRQFSTSEMLCQKNKFFCDSCCGLQEAEKRMKIKRLPNIMALHLKRFKYQESLGRYTKLFYRVPFPTQLRLPNTSDETEDPDRLYELFAVVVHIGNGPHHGHYVCLVRSGGRWVMCDDENVEPIDDGDVFRYFGDYPSGAGYVLFYQSVDLKASDLGLKIIPRPKPQPKAKEPSPSTPSAQTPARPEALAGIAEQNETHEPPQPAPARAAVGAPAPVTPSAVPAQTTPKTPLLVNIPQSTAPQVTSTPAPAPVAPATNGNVTRTIPSAITNNESVFVSPASTAPSQGVPSISPISQKSPTPAAPIAKTNGTAPALAPSLSPAQSAKKEEGGKWYQRRKSTSLEPTPPPVKQPVRQPVAPVPAPVKTPVASTPPSTAASSDLGRNPSVSQRDRTVSTSSQSSGSAFGTSAEKTANGNGSGLGRRMSGLGRMSSRSGSMTFGKLGFGKKDKDKS